MGNETSVCSGRGTCENGTCYCTNPIKNPHSYVGERCEFPRCYGFSEYYHPSMVCWGRGTCRGPDDCDCHNNQNYYGNECGEIIDPDTREKETPCTDARDFTIWKIKFQVSITIIRKYNLQGSFKCCVEDGGLIYCNKTRIANPLSICLFHQTPTKTETEWLVLYLHGDDQGLVENEGVDVKPVTDNDVISVRPPESRIITKEEEVVPNWLIALIIGLALLICCCLLLLLLLCLCCCCIVIVSSFSCCPVCCPSLFGTQLVAARQSLKLKKFEELEDFDVILAEQKAEKKTDNGYRGDSAKLDVKKELFEIGFDEIKLLKVLGSGGSGAVVYLASWSGKKVAFKVFKTKDLLNEESNYEEFEKEVNMISSLSHPNCLAFYGCSLKAPRIGIVMEFCENGDMRGFILMKQLSKEVIDEETKLRLMEETAAGMSFLHSRKIIHRDLKCENVLLDKSLVCKIMDFGLSRAFDETNSGRMTKHVGTAFYMAPEITAGTMYNEKVDVFSFGIMLYELEGVTVQPYGENVMGAGLEMRVAMDENYRPDISKLSDCPEWLSSLMVRCWSADPEIRPTFREVVTTLDEKSEPIRLKKEEEEDDDEKEEEKKEEEMDLQEQLLVKMREIREIRRSIYQIEKAEEETESGSDDDDEQDKKSDGYSSTSDEDYGSGATDDDDNSSSEVSSSDAKESSSSGTGSSEQDDDDEEDDDEDGDSAVSDEDDDDEEEEDEPEKTVLFQRNVEDDV